MFGIGTFELVLILIFGFLIFGPDKLPAIAKTVGQAISKFRSAQDEMSKVLKTEIYDPNSDEPFKNPLDTLAKVTGADKSDKTESFSDRKDRYDKQREAKRKAEERKKAAAVTTIASGTVAEKTILDESKAENEPKAKATKPKPSADELYGNKPASARVKADTKLAEPESTASVSTATPPASKTTTNSDDNRPASSRPTGKPAARPVAKPARTSNEEQGE